MRYTQLLFSVLAAIIGVGAAYASQPKSKTINDIYRWHTVNDIVVFTAPIVIAVGKCPPGTGPTCLIGTKAGVAIPTILYGTFQ